MADEAPTPVTKFEIARLELKKGDIVIFRSPDQLSRDVRGFLLEQLKGAFPGHQIMILEHGQSLDVLTMKGED